MKSTNNRDIKQWASNRGPNTEFKLFYLSGELLTLLNKLADDAEQSELIAQLIRDEHARRYERKP